MDQKTANRGLLKKLVASGKMEARVNYSQDADGNERDVTEGFMPARLSLAYGDFISGSCNFKEHDFTQKSGHAWKNEDGSYSLYTVNGSYTLREVKSV